MGPSAVIASLIIKMGLDPSGVATGAAQAERSVSGINKKVAAGAAIAGAIVGDAMFSSMAAFTAFDDRMREVFSLMPGVSQDAMDQMRSQVRKLAVDYGQDVEQVAGGLYQAISAGMDPTKAVAFMETATKAAVAGVSDTKTAATLLASTLNSYSLGAEHAEAVADTFFMTVRQGITTFPELAGVMANISPQASKMGVALDDTAAALAAMTKQGYDTASAATDIAAVFTLLQKGTPELSRVLKEAGYESGQAALDALGFQGTLEMLNDTAEKLGIAIPKMTGRVQAAQAIFALTGSKAEAAREVRDAYTEAGGAVDAAFKVMDAGVGGMSRRLAAQMHDLALSAGEFLQPLAPIFLAFGPVMGRWLGRGIGAGIGLAMTGVGAIIQRALPGLATEMSAMATQAGGSYAKALAMSIGSSIRGAGFKKLAFGGLAVGAGLALSSGALGDFGGIEKVAGSLLTVAGAFAIGGPVLGALAAVVMAINEIGNFLHTVEAAQAKLTDQVAAVSEQSGQEALANLANMTKLMKETQGWQRLVGDTFAGKEQLDALIALTSSIVNAETLSVTEATNAITLVTDAAAEAAARGNEKVAEQLRGQVTVLEGIRDAASHEADGIYRRVVDEVTEGADDVADALTDGAGDIGDAGDVAAAEVGRFYTKINAHADEIGGAWDTITGLLNKGPKITSLKQRVAKAGQAIRQNMRMLAKSIRRGDTVAAAFYTDAVVEGRRGRRIIIDGAERTMAEARAVLNRGRGKAKRIQEGMTADTERETRKGAKKAEANAKDSAEALPDALSTEKPKAATAAASTATAVSSKLEPLGARALQWGNSIGANLASGMASQVDAVAAQSDALAAAAAKNIHFSSPPPGPLSSIRQWGPHMMDEWLGPIRARVRDAQRLGDALGAAVRPRMLAADVGPAPGWERAHRGSVAAFGGDRMTPRSEVHLHIGTFIGDQAGIDELERRMSGRRRLGTRGRWHLGDAD